MRPDLKAFRPQAYSPVMENGVCCADAELVSVHDACRGQLLGVRGHWAGEEEGVMEMQLVYTDRWLKFLRCITVFRSKI